MLKKGLFLALFVLTAEVFAVEIDLSIVGVQRVAPNMIRLRNVTVPGYGNYWADMLWDPQQNVFRVANAGPDRLPQLAVTVARYTVARNSAPNLTQACMEDLTQACMEEFGPASRQADWQDVKGLLGSDNNALRAFIESSGIVPGDYYFVTYGKSVLTAEGNPYFMATGSAGGVQKEAVGGDALRLHYTSSTLTGKVVCVNTDLIGFPK
ncbi:hypothetical protein JCM13664_09880 [Methylothermus subterraneus]